MSFMIGIVIGVLFGIGLIVAFTRYQATRSIRRAQLEVYDPSDKQANTVAAFARMTMPDSRKIFPDEFYPTWVVFSQQQKLTWLNSHLDKIWPYVNEAASELIRTIVEPILEQYRPIVLSSITFSKLTLGTVAPQFTGISVVEDESEDRGVTLELEMKWDGNPNIVLDIKTIVGVGLPIQVKDIGFAGVFRLIFKPLVGEFPGFGAVSYSLRQKKKLVFTLKVVGGEISAIPGISDAIEEMIRDAIEDSITWPVRKIVRIIPGDYSDLELMPVGTLDVKLVQGKELKNKDIVGKSDPYVVLFVRPLRDTTKTSRTINNELNPIWNENFEFIVEDVLTQNLTVRVFDDEGVLSSKLIGCAQVALKDLEPGKVKDVWLKLVKDLEFHRDTKYRGQVHLELLYCPFGTESSFKNPFNYDFQLTTLEKTIKSRIDEASKGSKRRTMAQKQKVILRGVLSVNVISAENLPSVDLMGRADPFVVLTMKKSETVSRTRVIANSLNPVWNQTFNFVVEDALHEMLIVEVCDHDIFGEDKVGRCIMTLTRVLLEGEYRENFPLEGAKSGKLLLHLKWTPQLKFRDL